MPSLSKPIVQALHQGCIICKNQFLDDIADKKQGWLSHIVQVHCRQKDEKQYVSHPDLVHLSCASNCFRQKSFDERSCFICRANDTFLHRITGIRELEVNPYCKNNLWLAVKNRRAETTPLLLENNIELDMKGLNDICQSDFSSLVTIMISDHYEKTPHSTEVFTLDPFSLAVLLNDNALIEPFLDENINFDQYKGYVFSPLYIAVLNGNWNLVNHLIEKGATVDASMNNRSDCNIEMLMEPILFSPIIREAPKQLQLLIDNGGDVNAIETTGDALVTLAAMSSKPTILEIFIKAKANIHAKEVNYGNSLLHLSVFAKKKLNTEQLLRAGLNPNVVNSRKTPPLAIAAGEGDTTTAKLLLQYGADIDIKNIDGENALDIAKKYKKQDMTELLTQALYKKACLYEMKAKHFEAEFKRTLALVDKKSYKKTDML